MVIYLEIRIDQSVELCSNHKANSLIFVDDSRLNKLLLTTDYIIRLR